MARLADENAAEEVEMNAALVADLIEEWKIIGVTPETGFVLAICTTLNDLQNSPFCEIGLTNGLNGLRDWRNELAKIAPEHPLAKPLPEPFFPLCAYENPCLGWKNWLAKYKKSETRLTAEQAMHNLISDSPPLIP